MMKWNVSRGGIGHVIQQDVSSDEGGWSLDKSRDGVHVSKSPIRIVWESLSLFLLLQFRTNSPTSVSVPSLSPWCPDIG